MLSPPPSPPPLPPISSLSLSLYEKIVEFVYLIFLKQNPNISYKVRVCIANKTAAEELFDIIRVVRVFNLSRSRLHQTYDNEFFLRIRFSEHQRVESPSSQNSSKPAKSGGGKQKKEGAKATIETVDALRSGAAAKSNMLSSFTESGVRHLEHCSCWFQ
ncbi:hypothetical protein C5167_020990 [Papaver somniferum]|uniref:Uncharacterized protein n=1 Tax=Papaver somniferum TaxID=3469 RepID=A0A4Y7IYJ1_PAPSO|nr:hypothetical protein C5167_020990 [Papaver somniferum]